MSSGKEQHASGFSRREALRFLGSASALPLVQPLVRKTPWQPRFLGSADVETVARLSECIVPQTRVPGAVLEYIDEALYRAEPAVQASFTDGLSWLDRYAVRSVGRAFTELDRDEQHQLLAEISDTSRSHEPTGYAFLTQIKQLTIEGYYRS